MHLFDHINCYPYPIYVCCYPISPCCYPYYHQHEKVSYGRREKVGYRQRVEAAYYGHYGHEHGKG